MRIITLLTLILLTVFSYSCTTDNVEPPEEPSTRPVPPPGPTETVLLEMEVEYPDGSGRQPTVTDKGAVYLDNNARTITTYYSYMTDSMERRHFDNAWRLTKIVRYHRDFNQDPFVADSVVISRPAVNIFDIRYEKVGVSRCTVTATAGGEEYLYSGFAR